jgi:hypothetical protein
VADKPPDDSAPLTTVEILRRVAALPPEERKRAERALALHYQPSIIVNRTPEAEALEAQGWEPWLSELAPHVFRGTHAEFHRKFWNWYWPLLLAKRDGKRLVDLHAPLAYLLTLGRGLGKSTSVEWATIAMGALLGQTLTLYVSSTQKQARNHLNNIREEIEDSQIEKYYPGLSNPRIGKFDNRYGWNQDMLATTSGLTIFAVGLEEEVRGVKVRQLRPGLILLDEFDSKADSPDVVKKKEGIIGGSIFGTQVEDTIIVMAQNLIHGQSVAMRTFKRRNELLSYREESGLIGAFTEDMEIEMVGTRWMLTKGKPVWPYFKEETFQKFLDTSGPIETYAEYQHKFDRDREGRVLKNYNDEIMVITEEDFAAVYGCWPPPASWNKYVGNDTARTKTEWHANVGGTLTMSGMNTPLPGITFLYNCLSFEAETQPDDCAVAFLKCISPTVFVDGIEHRWEDLVQVIIAREGIDKFTSSLTEKINAQRQGLAKIIPKYVHPLIASQHYIRFRMSHEAADVQRIYRETFGLPFEPAVPTEGAGVDLINFAMKIDPKVADPFGRWREDEHGQRNPLMGMSRFYVVVSRDKLLYPDDNKPDQLFGSDLARYQFKEHRYLPPKLNALGEEERGQEKRNDDFINLLQFFYMDHSIMARELTPQELAEMKMPISQQLASIAAESDPEMREHMMMAREAALKKELFSRITRQLGNGGRPKPGNKMADMRRFERLRR